MHGLSCRNDALLEKIAYKILFKIIRDIAIERLLVILYRPTTLVQFNISALEFTYIILQPKTGIKLYHIGKHQYPSLFYCTVYSSIRALRYQQWNNIINIHSYNVI